VPGTKWLIPLWLCTFCGLLIADGLELPIYHAAPPRLPGISPEMNTPGFWIARHPYPDSLIMQSFQIDKLNRYINKQGTVTKIWQHSTRMNGNTVRKQIKEMLTTLYDRGVYGFDGLPVPDSIKSLLHNNAAIDEIPASIKVRFAFPTSLARQRFAPGHANLNKLRGDTEFDEGQNSGEQTGSPLVLYHDSADSLWVFGASATSSGWFLKSELCIVPHSDWLACQNAETKVVCLEARSDLWLDEQATAYAGFCRMGASFPYLGEAGAYYRILLFSGDGLKPGFIAKNVSGKGFLPFTPRNVYLQAFKLLNMPYGWGDTGSDFDCSSLLKSLFATFGIVLPRNGLQQVRALKDVVEFDSKASPGFKHISLLKSAVPGLSLIRLNGHVMLYLGQLNGKAFALHNIWGYRSPGKDGKDEVYVINRTVVSDLELGMGSQKGSLLSRITHFGEIR